MIIYANVASTLYKGYLLISRAEYDAKIERWIARANVSWDGGGSFSYYTLDGDGARYTTEEEAVFQGFAMAKLWVDNRL